VARRNLQLWDFPLPDFPLLLRIKSELFSG